MSAFIVSRTHIDAMVAAAIRRGIIDASEADATGRMLWRENLLSVAFRYSYDGDGERPGPSDFRDRDVLEYTFAPETLDPMEWPLDNSATATTCECYAYQACEHPGWETSQAKVLCDALLRTTNGAGWDRLTPWGW